jgi:hypothetical protein
MNATAALRACWNRALGRICAIAATARTIASDLRCELRRLNRLGRETGEFADGSRRTRARIIRERLKAGYRGHTPCC